MPRSSLTFAITCGAWMGLVMYAFAPSARARWRSSSALSVVMTTIGTSLWTGSVRTRFTSMFQPKREVDSNQHRIITWRTGLRMIEAHPWLGLGPEQVKVQFLNYVPADVPRPLPTGWYGHLHNIYLHYAAERGDSFLKKIARAKL